MKVLIVTLLLLYGCAARQAPLGQPVSRPDFAYEKVGEAYHLFARTQQAYKQALQEICGQNVCTVERAGEIYVITVTP